MNKVPADNNYYLVASKYDYPNGVLVKWYEGSNGAGWKLDNGNWAFGPDDTLICWLPIEPPKMEG